MARLNRSLWQFEEENTMNAKEYLAQLAQAAELTQEERDAILKVADKEKFAKGLEEGVLMRSDYSRNMDALKAEKAKAEAEWGKATNYYAQLLEYKANLDAGVLAAQPGVQPGVQPVQPGIQPNGDFISKKDFDAMKQQMEGSYINLLKAGLSLVDRHRMEFPTEPLDLNALEKTAVEKKISLDQAYGEWAGPKRAEKSKLDLEARLKQAKEEGAREFASTHKIPMVDAQREFHPIFDRAGAQGQAETKDGRLTPAGERALRDSFVEAWNSGGTNTSGT